MSVIGPRQLSVLLALSLVAAACGREGSGAPATALARSDAERATGDAKTAPAVDAVNHFGFDLLASYLGQTKGNVVVSPWSIVSALTMARAGAKGDTATEMDQVLQIAEPSTINAAMNALGLSLDADNGTFPLADHSGTIELSTADRAFLQHDMPLVPAYLDTLARYFGAGVGLVDYVKATEAARQAINTWVSDETHARIPELLAKGTLDEMARLVLVNAVYLKADWMQPFEKDSTTDAPFHAPAGDVTARFMHNQDDYGFARGDRWVAVTLPYVGDRLAMTIVLPDDGRFDEVAGTLAEVLTAASVTQTAAVNLALPKFDIAFLDSLKPQLEALGMVKAFDPDLADFSGMTEAQRLYVSDVVHGANLTVDEQGTVAAAATAVIMRAAGAPLKVEQVTVDRPFLFALRDTPTATVLFAGQVTNPTVPS
jgi:serine protease inhibitor